MSKFIFEQYIKNLIKLTWNGFSENVEKFDLRSGDNGFPEANLTFHFARNFQNENRYVFMQPAFQSKKRDKVDHHFDCVAIDPKKELIIFVETKRLYSLGKLREICSDATKLRKNEHTLEIQERVNKNFKIKYRYGLILAEVWDWDLRRNHIQKWWGEREYKLNNWDKELMKPESKEFKDFSRNVNKEGLFVKKEDSTVYCCYAFTNLDD